jgi:hypothetical protein
VSSAPLAAQDAVLGQIYGNGVHAYFAQDYVKAHQLLTSAIDGHSQDPRCFYYRGLALLKLGRPQEAEADFQRGAKLEGAIDQVRAYDVARALERVQGSDRTTLEQFRMEARMSVLKKAEADRAQRYETNIKDQRAFLQQQSEASPANRVESSNGGTPTVPGDGGKAPAVVPPASTDPFDEGKPKKDEAGATPAGPDAAKPGETTEPSAVPGATPDTPPVGGTPDAAMPPAEKPAGTDPFSDAGGAAKPATPAGDAEKPEPAKPGAATPDAAKPDAGDPFGDTGGAAKPATPAAGAAKPDAAKPDAGDPFGDTGGAAKPATPAAGAATPDAAKPDAGDPFGDVGGTAKPDAAKPAEKKPAEEKKPASDDPFGS